MSWKTIESKKKADFPLFKVFEDVVILPNGEKLDYYKVEKNTCCHDTANNIR